MRMRLPKPRDRSTAKQCRQMGIKVGDTIIGRETYSNGHWSEAKLTLLFAGKDEAVWKVMRRSHDKPHWRSTGEQSNWTLECREWWLVVPNAELTGQPKASVSQVEQLRGEFESLRKAVAPFAAIISDTSGRVPTERLSLSNWHDLVKAFNKRPNAS